MYTSAATCLSVLDRIRSHTPPPHPSPAQPGLRSARISAHKIPMTHPLHNETAVHPTDDGSSTEWTCIPPRVEGRDSEGKPWMNPAGKEPAREGAEDITRKPPDADIIMACHIFPLPPVLLAPASRSRPSLSEMETLARYNAVSTVRQLRLHPAPPGQHGPGISAEPLVNSLTIISTALLPPATYHNISGCTRFYRFFSFIPNGSLGLGTGWLPSVRDPYPFSSYGASIAGITAGFFSG